jgi:crotonobetainyl-CoA:carnitine CoA-transferase CaiB-like acyl-CoA transferase
MMLADLGADVIKVESPGTGDPYRNFNGLYSPHFQAYNRNKRSIALDMKQPEDLELFHGLVATADVYIQNFRPGTADRLGASAARLHEINPRLIYCSISGFGPDGPYAKRPSYDSVAQAVSGFLSMTIDKNHPRLLGPALADALTGIYASLGITGALVERGRTGRGKVCEISMLETMMHFATEPFYWYYATGEVPSAADRPRIAQAFVVRCGCGSLLALHLSSLDKFWTELVSALEFPGLSNDARFGQRTKRIANYEDLQTTLDSIFSGRSRDAWIKRLSLFDLPYAPVNSVAQVAEDPQVAHMEIIVPVTAHQGGAEKAVRPPFGFDGSRAKKVKAAPQLDEDGANIRRAMQQNRKAWPEAEQAL